METILEPLVRSPKFPRYVDQLIEFRLRETQARQRFRDDIDEDIRAEFINGEVVTQMTARYLHTTTIRRVGRIIDAFAEIRHCGVVVVEQALTSFTRNDYAPDICFWSNLKSAGFTNNTSVFPVPDFIVEVISPSTEARDRGVKFEDYAEHGVREYWIIDPESRTIEQYLERAGQYDLTGKVSNGTIQSVVIEGLEIPVDAVFDDQANLEMLRRILAK